jgi:hypothetical protein
LTTHPAVDGSGLVPGRPDDRVRAVGARGAGRRPHDRAGPRRLGT